MNYTHKTILHNGSHFLEKAICSSDQFQTSYVGRDDFELIMDYSLLSSNVLSCSIYGAGGQI